MYLRLRVDADLRSNRYNDVFKSPAKLVSLGSPDGAWAFNNGRWPGQPHFTAQFANETSKQIEVKAGLLKNSSFDHPDGQSIFKTQCIPQHKASELEGESPEQLAAKKSAPPLYPTSVVRESKNLISGYYLNDTDLQDVAV